MGHPYEHGSPRELGSAQNFLSSFYSDELLPYSSQPNSPHQYLPVEEHDGVQRLVLGGRGDVALERELDQKRLHFHGPDPRFAASRGRGSAGSSDVGLPGADAVVQPADDVRT